MGYGKHSGGNALFVTLMGMKQEEPKPYFEIKKSKEEIVSTDNSFIEGTLEKIELGQYEYKGKMRDTFKVYLRDGDELLIWSTSRNGISRNFINSVCNLENKNVQLHISVYVNKQGYKSVYVTHKGQPIGWKFDYEKDIKPLIVPILDAKGEFDKNDYSLLDEMYMKEIEAMVFNPLNDPKGDVVFEERSVEELVEPKPPVTNPVETPDDELPF